LHADPGVLITLRGANHNCKANEWATAICLTLLKLPGRRADTFSIVMQELRAGAVTDAQAKVLQDGIFDAFERRKRVVAPSAIAFKDCARILATLFTSDAFRAQS
jgi:hypothetical protein